MAKRFVLEGEWTGYTSSHRRVVHCELVTAKRAEALRGLRCITYTDGTALLLSVREALPRERVTEIKSYSTLINDALRTGKSRVAVAEMDDDEPEPDEDPNNTFRGDFAGFAENH